MFAYPTSTKTLDAVYWKDRAENLSITIGPMITGKQQMKHYRPRNNSYMNCLNWGFILGVYFHCPHEGITAWR